MMSEDIQYEQRVCFFIDILGFKHILEKEKSAQEINDLLSFIETSTVKGWLVRDEIPSKRVICFSDSIVVSFDYKNPSSLFYSLKFFQELQTQLFGLHGILLRGGCCIGNLVHSEKRVYGEALNKAYLLESKKAEYPRIILSEETINECSKYSENQGLWGLSEREQVLKVTEKDDDDLYYINYISHYYYPCLQNPEDFDPCDYYESNRMCYDYLLAIRGHIENGLKLPKESIQKKYLWLKDKYNKVVEDPLLNLDEITESSKCYGES